MEVGKIEGFFTTFFFVGGGGGGGFVFGVYRKIIRKGVCFIIKNIFDFLRVAT